ncbi:ABC transporter substrate-binding protein [Marinomonas agarivorans]|nr:ABC transporter substrate-binding protein [Marinomonas agarivorans]
MATHATTINTQTISTKATSAKTIKIALDHDPISLDPHEQLTEKTLQTSHLLFDPLLRWTQDNTLEARLATHWRNLDAHTTRFFLRDNVTFHSGNPLTVDDVVFTIERLKKSPDFKALFDNILTVKKVDRLTFDIVTKKPTPLLLNLMTYVFPMDHQFYQDKDRVLKFGKSFASYNVSGTGPFIVTKREQGKQIDFIRNPNYWDTSSKGNIGRIELTPIKSNSTRLAALLSDDVDFIHPVAPLDTKRLENTANIDLITLLSSRVLLLQLNQTKRAEFQDIRVRKAINLAINQQLIVDKVLKGLSKAAGQLSHEQFMGHVEELQPLYNLDQARQLMQEAGYASGFRVSMITSYGINAQVAQAIESMLAKINIQIDLKAVPAAQYLRAIDERSTDLLLMSWLSDTQDSNNLFEFLIACTDEKTGFGAFNTHGYCNPAIDNMINAANEELDQTKRRDLLQTIEKQLAADAVFVPIAWLHLSWAAKRHINLHTIVNNQNLYYLGDTVVSD